MTPRCARAAAMMILLCALLMTMIARLQVIPATTQALRMAPHAITVALLRIRLATTVVHLLVPCVITRIQITVIRRHAHHATTVARHTDAIAHRITAHTIIRRIAATRTEPVRARSLPADANRADTVVSRAAHRASAKTHTRLRNPRARARGILL